MIINIFKRCLATKPLPTQMCIASIISGSGDCSAQYFSKNNEWDYCRTLRFSFLSGCFMAPTLFFWYRRLDRFSLNGTKVVALSKRLAIDQLMFSPIFNACILFNLRLLQFWSPQKSFSMMKSDWPNIYSDSLKVWPIVQFVNLSCVPLNYRVILNQIVAFFWNSYISYRTQMPIDHHEQFY